MRLLILTQYYPPEVGAPQNRLHELAVRLKANGVHVEVLTALPNYPEMRIHEDYLSGEKNEEEIDGIPVHRASIYVSESKKIVNRLRNYFSFVYSSWKRGKKLPDFDFLMVESPPLFLGYSAIRLAKKLNAKLIFNVSDLWPESAEKMGIVTNKQMLGAAYRLEAKCYRNSSLVTGQTMGIVDNIKNRFPNTNVYWLPNGVDISFYDPIKINTGSLREEMDASVDDVLFFYGGIIGHAQGLETVLHAANIVRDNKNIKIIFQGAGPVKDDLLKLNKELKLKNVFFRDPVQKSEMPGVLKSVDVALVPLRKLDLFQGAIPSKIFEAQAMKLPLLLGVEGEAKRHFIDNAQSGLFYEPENAQDMADKMLIMASDKTALSHMGDRAREYVSTHFNRNNIANGLLEELNKMK